MTIPARATSFADKARAAGWTVQVLTGTGSPVGPDGEPERTVVRVPKADEDGGGYRQVPGEVKVVESVAVRCRRGRDVLIALWEDGSFRAAVRPHHLAMLNSSEALDHIQNSAARPCRYVPCRLGYETCIYHSETRERA